MEKISGDPQGIEVLKALVEENRDYMRFLLTEAQTNVDHAAPFSSRDGAKYLLKLDPASGRLEVTPAA